MSLHRCLAVALFCALTSSTYAQTPGIDVKVIGVSFFEAPPQRDKNLAVFSTGSTQEKVDVYAVITSAGKRFADASGPSTFDKGEVKVSAVLANKTTVALGTAEMSSFAKLSSDGKSRTLNLSITRLPDQAVQGLIFEGRIPLSIAKGLVKITSAFAPTAGSAVKFNDVSALVSKISGQTITLTGTQNLSRLAGLSLKLNDGRIIAAERRGWGSMNSEVYQEWAFAAPIAAGTLSAEMYEGLETIQQPIKLVVGKPY